MNYNLQYQLAGLNFIFTPMMCLEGGYGILNQL